MESSTTVDRRTERRRTQLEETRTLLLEVARCQLRDDEDASLSAIARAAGVGIGTVYRHFRSREGLIVTLYRDELALVGAEADELLAELPPLDALRAWLERLALRVTVLPGLAGAMQALSLGPTPGSGAPPAESDGDPGEGQILDDTPFTPVRAALGRLVAANEAASTIRPGLSVDDLLLAAHSLYCLDHRAERWPVRARLLLDIVVRGLAPSS